MKHSILIKQQHKQQFNQSISKINKTHKTLIISTLFIL